MPDFWQRKPLRLMACCAAITISAVGNSFFVFLEFLSLAVRGGFFNFSGTRSTHSACVGAYIDPLPVSMPDATREARRPMGSRFPGLTLMAKSLRQ
nr:MAG TPA: hypothetical protein [Caudoviricetes sp.]